MLTWILLAAAGLGADWPQFRGPEARGASAETGLPLTVSEAENVAWKAALPGPGPSSPIVVDGVVMVTAASGPRQERLHVLAFDAATGHARWQRTIWATGPTVCASFGGVAASTPVSDGRRVYALFSSNDLLCFDLDGNLKWLRGLSLESPLTRNDLGMASSPLVAGDTVVVQLASPGESFAAGLDAQTGRTRWKRPLENDACWTTPVLWKGSPGEDDAVVLQTESGLAGLEPLTGKELWTHAAPCSTISSATPAGDWLFVPAEGLTALKRAAEGAGLEPVWKESRLRMENVSPVVEGGRVYVIKSPGILVAGDTATGRVLWQLRLKGPIWATPAVADGHLYTISHAGLVQVVRLGAERGEVVASAQFDGDALASPAIAGGAVYFRTRTSLWKIAK